jgi:hypothetical protein
VLVDAQVPGERTCERRIVICKRKSGLEPVSGTTDLGSCAAATARQGAHQVLPPGHDRLPTYTHCKVDNGMEMFMCMPCAAVHVVHTQVLFGTSAAVTEPALDIWDVDIMTAVILTPPKSLEERRPVTYGTMLHSQTQN